LEMTLSMKLKSSALTLVLKANVLALAFGLAIPGLPSFLDWRFQGQRLVENVQDDLALFSSYG